MTSTMLEPGAGMVSVAQGERNTSSNIYINHLRMDIARYYKRRVKVKPKPCKSMVSPEFEQLKKNPYSFKTTSPTKLGTRGRWRQKRGLLKIWGK